MASACVNRSLASNLHSDDVSRALFKDELGLCVLLVAFHQKPLDLRLENLLRLADVTILHERLAVVYALLVLLRLEGSREVNQGSNAVSCSRRKACQLPAATEFTLHHVRYV